MPTKRKVVEATSSTKKKRVQMQAVISNLSPGEAKSCNNRTQKSAQQQQPLSAVICNEDIVSCGCFLKMNDNDKYLFVTKIQRNAPEIKEDGFEVKYKENQLYICKSVSDFVLDNKVNVARHLQLNSVWV